MYCKILGPTLEKVDEKPMLPKYKKAKQNTLKVKKRTKGDQERSLTERISINTVPTHRDLSKENIERVKKS